MPLINPRYGKTTVSGRGTLLFFESKPVWRDEIRWGVVERSPIGDSITLELAHKDRHGVEKRVTHYLDAEALQQLADFAKTGVCEGAALAPTTPEQP